MDLKTVIITGASSGLGFETAKKIAKNFKNYRIILACRNLQKANAKKEEIEKETQNKNLIVMEIDTSSLGSVKNFVTNYKNSSFGKIYSIVCNAGIAGTSKGERTKDGFDDIFATNHLGHFLLVNSLLPLMEENGAFVSLYNIFSMAKFLLASKSFLLVLSLGSNSHFDMDSGFFHKSSFFDFKCLNDL